MLVVYSHKLYEIALFFQRMEEFFQRKKDMKRLLLFIPAVCFSFLLATWHEDYEVAYTKARAENKNMFLYFIGSDYCPWCKKFSTEILETSAFKDAVTKYFEFVYVDFPAKKKLSEKQYLNNKKLKEKYEIVDFPTVVIIDTDGQIITKIGYLPIGPKKYADNLIQIVEQYNELKEKDISRLNSFDLKLTYEKAKAIGNESFKDKTINEGLKKEGRLYFLFEKYIALLDKQKLTEANEIRKEIIESDPHNLLKSFFRLAMIDFEVLAKDKNISDPKKVITPLVEYIKEFGKKDKTNLWRLEMLISQYLSSKDMLKEALTHARASYKAAPMIIRKELVQTILYLKHRIQEEESLAESTSE